MFSRINLVMQTKNLTASQFADEIGVQRSSMSHIISGRNNPSLDFIMKILNRFPEIRTDWMIFGKGSMHESEQLSTKKEETETVKELDLFSNGLFEKQPSIKNEIKEEQYSNNYPKNEEVNSEQSTQKLINEGMDRKEEKHSDVVKEKTIKKMIIFFSDNTFEELTPEKK